MIAGIWERIELMFLQGLSTGVALADTDNIGTGVRVDYGYLTENKFGVKVVWEGNTSTSKPIDDIRKVLKKLNKTAMLSSELMLTKHGLTTSTHPTRYASSSHFCRVSSVPISLYLTTPRQTG